MPVKICLSYEQIKGNDKFKILLNETQKKKIDQSKELKKGFELELSHEQIETGGVLPILLAILGAAGAAAGRAAAVANSVISAKHQSAEEEMKEQNKEMEIAKNSKSLSIGPSLKKKKQTK